MAAQNESLGSWPVVQQLRRMRAVYAAGVVLWAVSSIGTAWSSPGSGPMWTSVLLLMVFTGLLALSSWWLRRMGPVAGAERKGRAVAHGVTTARHART
ncbi:MULTISPECIES: hypothetical protein [Streptomyces]|uniref:hypothetical protein n=1 Tax=Streptomyces TaxID=1883 RepID=UPI00068C5BE6|nr:MULTISPECIES: hypothetical protein [unclassified Streptomyces]SEE05682.1 hypothetical protein SAMN05216482_8947 [Streptomyces sp. PAN_FS17]SEE72652.1 hypothetical protein SAMN05428938_8344 [Streptomyces sp. KS_5]